MYAHQLDVVEKSNINKSYFKGTYYLIESSYDNKTLFFEHSEELSEGRVVYLKINK